MVAFDAVRCRHRQNGVYLPGTSQVRDVVVADEVTVQATTTHHDVCTAGRSFLFKTPCVTQPATKVMHYDYPSIVNLIVIFFTVRCPFAGRRSYL